MIDDRVLPNPFLVADADIVLEALERRLAGEQPLFMDPVFEQLLDAAVALAADDDDPVRHRKGVQIIARLRELAR